MVVLMHYTHKVLPAKAAALRLGLSSPDPLPQTHANKHPASQLVGLRIDRITAHMLQHSDDFANDKGEVQLGMRKVGGGGASGGVSAWT